VRVTFSRQLTSASIFLPLDIGGGYTYVGMKVMRASRRLSFQLQLGVIAVAWADRLRLLDKIQTILIKRLDEKETNVIAGRECQTDSESIFN
jgi:hypothetical protein